MRKQRKKLLCEHEHTATEHHRIEAGIEWELLESNQ